MDVIKLAPVHGSCIRVSTNRRALLVDGTPIDLTNHEFAIGSRVVRARGDVVPHESLLRAMYGGGDEPETAALVLRVTLHRLRKKLRRHGIEVITHHGLGLRLFVPGIDLEGPVNAR